MSTQIEIVSVSGGKFHRPEHTTFDGGGNVFRDARLMRCGRSLVPLNVFETIADANRYTGGRLETYICQQCEKKVSHMWRVPQVLKNDDARPRFTSGPYVAQPLQWDQGASIAICSTGDDARILATIAPENADEHPDMDTAIRAPEDEDNARLFAAAPTLYDALRVLLPLIPAPAATHDGLTLADAIATARGALGLVASA